MAVLAILIGLILRLVSGTTAITGLGQAEMDTDAQARALLNRMGTDLGAMVKRTDVDYYLKGRPITNTMGSGGAASAQNDLMAFYSEVPGYFTVASGSSSTPPPTYVSVVAYRVNSNTMHMERLSKGLDWNGTALSRGATVYFLPVPLASPLSSPLPSPMPNPSPTPVWPQAANASPSPSPPDDLDYEEIGPQVFRFEYYYVLNNQPAGFQTPAPSPASNTSTPAPTPLPSVLSNVPWDTRVPLSHTDMNGLRDVAAIGVMIAVIDQKSRTLVSNAQLAALAAQMEDSPEGMADPQVLESNWQQAVNQAPTSLQFPRTAASAIRIYTRSFPLTATPP